MASENKPAQAGGTEKNWLKRESMGSFVRDVLIAAVICGGILWYYHGSVEKGKQVRALGREARELSLKDQPASLDQAIGKYKQMLEIESDNAFAISSLAVAEASRFLDLGIKSAEQPMHEWAAKAGKLNANINERFGAVLLDQYASGKYPEVITEATALAEKAASSYIINALGLAQAASGKIGEAKQALKRAADTDWRNPRFACDMGDIYFADGDFGNAQGAYTKGLEANSDHGRSLVGRARSQIARNVRTEDASRTLAELIEMPEAKLGPRVKANAFVGAGEYYMLEGQLEPALVLADKALALDTNSAWAHFLKARVFARAKNAGASEEIDKALQFAKYTPEFYFTGAKELAAGGMGEKGLAILNAGKTFLADDDRYYVALGDQLKGLGRLDEAFAAYTTACEKNDMNAMAHYARGALAFEHKKDLGLAREEFGKALYVQDFFPEVHAKQGEMLFAEKKWEEGVQEFGTAIVKFKQIQKAEMAATLRDSVNERLLKEAKDKEMAKAWMDETAAMVR